MAYWRSQGLCLRLVDWRETSLICTYFTRERGKVGVVAKGARRHGSRFRDELALLTLADLVCVDRKSTPNLYTLSEAEIVDAYRGARQELARLHAATYVLELVRELVADADPHPQLFDLAVRALERIARNQRFQPSTIVIFELLALRAVGNLLELTGCVVCGEAWSEDSVDYMGGMGGGCCSNCRGSREGPAIRAARLSVEIMAQAAEDPRAVAPGAWSPAVLMDARKILDAALEHYIDRPLRMSAYLRAAVSEVGG